MFKRRLQFISNFVRYMPLMIGLLFLFGAIIYALYIWIFFPAPGENTLYWFHQSIFSVPKLLLLALVPLSALFTAGQMYILRKHRRRLIITSVVGLVFICAWMTACFASLNTFFGQYTFHDELTTVNHVYRLDSERKLGIGSTSRAVYWLWQCDERGHFCHILHAQRLDGAHLRADNEISASLRLNSQSNEVEFLMDGDVIFTYALNDIHADQKEN